MTTMDMQATAHDLEAAGADPRLAAVLAERFAHIGPRRYRGPSSISILAVATTLGFALVIACMGWLLSEVHTTCRACCRVCGGNVGSALPFFVAYRLTLSDYRSFAITRADHGAFVEDAFAELPFLNPSHILFIILRPIHINFRTSVMVPCL